MEDALGVCPSFGKDPKGGQSVLILVIMEDALGG